MSYVGRPFEFDIFVSYGRANRTGTEDSALREWSLAFAQQLKKYLRGPRRFDTIELYLDEDDIRRSQSHEQFSEAAGSAAILLTLISEDYLASDWCKQELEAWVATEQAIRLARNDLALIIRVEPTAETQWWPRLKNRNGVAFPGYLFHEQPKHRRHVGLPLGFPIPDYRKEGQFQTVMTVLLQDIWEHLQFVQEELTERRQVQEQADRLKAPNPALYLHGRPGHEAIWESLNTQLVTEGFDVRPSAIVPIPKTPAQEQRHQQERMESMQECAALLVVSTENDSTFEADLTYLEKYVRRSLQARGSPLIPCAVLNWTSDPELRDDRQELAQLLKVKWIDCTEENWPQHVRLWLREMAPV